MLSKLIKIILLISLLFHTILNADLKEKADELSQILKMPLYQLDLKYVEETLNLFIKKEYIDGIEFYNQFDEENSPTFSFYKEGDKIIFNRGIAINSRIDKTTLNIYTAKIKHPSNDTIIGKVILYGKAKFGEFINLTTKEKEYLKNKKQITMCIDPAWMPFEEFDKKGNHVGMSADYFKIFQKDLGVPINIIKTKSWIESLEAAKKRECDIISLNIDAGEENEYMNYTSSYLSIPLVLAAKLNVRFFDDFKSLKNEKIGIVKGYAFNEIIKKKYPNIKVIDVENLKDGLQRVANGELFGFIDTIASIGYMFQTEFVGELKIAGKFEDRLELRTGVRNDDPVLLNILEKSIQNLSPETKQSIFSKHIAINYEKTTDYTLLIKVLIVALLFILVGVYHNRKLATANNKLEKLQHELKEQAHRDPLTNLYNRRYFHDVASDLLKIDKRAKRDIGIIMIDIDFFKKVNDTHGHNVGDDVIKKLASLLVEYTRESDIICRFGGEEFVVLLPNTDISGSFKIASKLREVVEKSGVTLDNAKVISFTISLGVDEVLETDSSIDNSLIRVDDALYEAKEGGRNKVVVYDGSVKNLVSV